MATPYKQHNYAWKGADWATAAKAYAGLYSARQAKSEIEMYNELTGSDLTPDRYEGAFRGRPDQNEGDESARTAVQTVRASPQSGYGGYEINLPGSEELLALGAYLQNVELPEDLGTFDPYAHVRGTEFEGAETKKTAQSVSKKYGLPEISPDSYNAQDLQKALDAYGNTIQRVFVDDPFGDEEERSESPLASGALTGKLTDRNLIYAQYADLSKRLLNAQSAQSSAATTTMMLQNKMRGLVKGKGNFFENLKESAEADVRIGSNAQSQRRPKKTSRSTSAATARSKVLVRAPGINI